MARSARNARLENRTARLKLAKGRRYQVTLRDGLALCYRRTTQGFGIWSARIENADGREKLHKIGGADDLDDADGVDVFDYVQAQDKARELAKHKPPPPYTVADATEHYLAWYREHRRAVTATEATVRAHILTALGDRRVADLTTTELKAWRDKLARQKARTRTGIGRAQKHKADAKTAEQREETKRARKATANRILAVLKAILNKAFEDERVPDDSAWRRVKPFGKVDVPRVRFLEESEALRLVNACSPEFRPLVRAALLTGARYGELTRLKVGDFTPTTRQIYIAPSKSGRSRHVPLNDAGMELFRTLTAGQPLNAPMFARADGGSWGKNHQQRPMLEACRGARVSPSLRFHELRHTYASALAQAGADLLTIAKLLGHADTRITARHYAHLCDKTLARAVNGMLPAFGEEAASNVQAIR